MFEVLFFFSCGSFELRSNCVPVCMHVGVCGRCDPELKSWKIPTHTSSEFQNQSQLTHFVVFTRFRNLRDVGDV